MLQREEVSTTSTTVYDAASDGELLERFVRQRDEAAFAAVVRRHGPMVLSVCRRVLGHDQDAEDAFQATFLVLARKASNLRDPALLANWLYGVAYRTAKHARSRAARRAQREREAASMARPQADSSDSPHEFERIVDEEILRLPEKYRAPLILCYLQGKTHAEAARLLGWPVGSMSHRVSRGLDLLRERLHFRLAALSLLPAIMLDNHLQPAAVPALLTDATVQAAQMLLVAKCSAVCPISASVRELMEATSRSMAPSWRNWLIGGGLVVLMLLSLSVGSCIATGGNQAMTDGGGGGGCHSSP